MFKKILFVIIGIIALVLIIAAFVPNKFHVEKEVVINKSKSDVFSYLVMLRNQDNWSVWAKRDPEMKKEYQGTDGSVGFISSWSGNKEVGVGEQEIKKINDGERIEYELRFKEPFESKADVFVTTESVSDMQTKVKWGFDSKMPYPFNFMCLFMDMTKEVGNDFQTGLDNLKTLMEQQQPATNEQPADSTQKAGV